MSRCLYSGHMRSWRSGCWIWGLQAAPRYSGTTDTEMEGVPRSPHSAALWTSPQWWLLARCILESLVSLQPIQKCVNSPVTQNIIHIYKRLTRIIPIPLVKTQTLKMAVKQMFTFKVAKWSDIWSLNDHCVRQGCRIPHFYNVELLVKRCSYESTSHRQADNNFIKRFVVVDSGHLTAIQRAVWPACVQDHKVCRLSQHCPVLQITWHQEINTGLFVITLQTVYNIWSIDF